MKLHQLKEFVKQTIREEQDYQQLFKHMLDKTGKSIPDMSDDEKKKFFNAVDTAYKAKSEGRLRGYNEAELTAGQKKIDVDGDGEIEGSDLAALRAGKKADESVNEANKPGDRLTHKHNPKIEIELIEPTNKGWKVYQIEKGKKKIAYFDKHDISGNNSLFESVNEGAGTLTIEKRKDGKYYWQYKFKSGKTEDWPAGFNTKADAQKDFMYRSKYIKESVNEGKKVFKLKGFNR